MANYNLDSSSPLATILKAFKNFYLAQDSELLLLPKEDKTEGYWSDMWFDFKKVEPFETFLPYLFYTGLVTQEHWEAFVKYGSFSFKAIDDMVNEGVYSSPMDWLETVIDYPHWYNHQQYLKTGAELDEFIESIVLEFEGEYIEFDKVHSKEFWKEFSNLSETNVMWLLGRMKNHPKPSYKVQESYTPKIFGIPNPNWKEKKEAVLERLKFENTDGTLKGVLGKSDKPWM